MIVCFTVPGIVGKNAAYIRLRRDIVTGTGRRMGLILSREGRAYKYAVKCCGLRARDESAWPRDVWIPKSVRLTVEMFGTRHDAGAATQLIKDGLEMVFFQNDRIVCQGAESPSKRDGSAPHVDVTVELLETYSAQEAMKRRLASEARCVRKFAGKRER